MKTLLKRYFKLLIDGYFLYRLDVGKLPEQPAAALLDGYSTRELDRANSDDVKQLYRIWGEAYFDDPQQHSDRVRREVDELLQSDDVCVLLFCGDDVVGMLWAGFGQAFQRYNFAHCLQSENDAGLFHHSYISPAHRGKRQQIPKMWYAHQLLKARGVKALYSFVGVSNFASVKNMMTNYDEYQIIYHIKIDIPKMQFNLFPGLDINHWRPCSS